MNPKDRNNIQIEGKLLRYNGAGESDSDAGAIRAITPISLSNPYFEVKLISKGRDGYIGIGLGSAAASLKKLPGWELESYAYHADDGKFFGSLLKDKKISTGRKYGPTFSDGDVVGCGYLFRDRSIFFTRVT